MHIGHLLAFAVLYVFVAEILQMVMWWFKVWRCWTSLQQFFLKLFASQLPAVLTLSESEYVLVSSFVSFVLHIKSFDAELKFITFPWCWMYGRSNTKSFF